MLRSRRQPLILIVASLAAICLTCPLFAAEPKVEPLWPAGAPGAKGDSPADKPTLTIYLPDKEKASGGAVVVIPGGGYGGTAMGHEGHQIAQWLNTLGMAGFICDYRHRGRGYGHPAPMQDAQRAIRTVRARAAEFGIDPKKVGVIGFSAGGHLASTVSTHFDGGDPAAADPIDKQSSRPDFSILCYGVLVFGDPKITHMGSQNNLLGKDAPAELVSEFSNDKKVTKDTPPTFLFHTSEDAAVRPENSVLYYLACKQAGVNAELHIYEKGQHGVGLAAKLPGASDWPSQCAIWLQGRGVAKK